MNKQINLAITTILFLLLSSVGELKADTIIDFEDPSVGAMFEGNTAGTSVGPITIGGFVGDVDATFTTSAVNGMLDASSFGLGVNSGGSDSDTESFNVGESWEVSVDVNVALVGINIGGLQSEETFRIQSDGWIGRSFSPGAGATFDSTTGTFSLTDGQADDTFNTSSLTGGALLSIAAGETISFGNLTSTFGPDDDVEIQSLTFASIPEPGSGVVVMALGSWLLAQRRKKRG